MIFSLNRHQIIKCCKLTCLFSCWSDTPILTSWLNISCVLSLIVSLAPLTSKLAGLPIPLAGVPAPLPITPASLAARRIEGGTRLGRGFISLHTLQCKVCNVQLRCTKHFLSLHTAHCTPVSAFSKKPLGWEFYHYKKYGYYTMIILPISSVFNSIIYFLAWLAWFLTWLGSGTNVSMGMPSEYPNRLQCASVYYNAPWST